jgi:hypothetical protein
LSMKSGSGKAAAARKRQDSGGSMSGPRAWQMQNR